jgi:hypothetical protein
MNAEEKADPPPRRSGAASSGKAKSGNIGAACQPNVGLAIEMGGEMGAKLPGTGQK